MSAAAAGIERNYVKWAFFALIAVCALLVLNADERFLINPADPHWKHIAPFEWLLLLHGIGGAAALLLGPLQFSDRLRAARPALHRWIGRLYVSAVLFVAAPFGLWIGAHFEPRAIMIEQYFQAGGWWVTTLMAYISIRNRQIAQHKLWMMRSYGFCLVFIISRVPDAFIASYSDQFLADMLWSLVIAALIGPDLIMMVRDGGRRRARRPAPG